MSRVRSVVSEARTVETSGDTQSTDGSQATTTDPGDELQRNQRATAETAAQTFPLVTTPTRRPQRRALAIDQIGNNTFYTTSRGSDGTAIQASLDEVSGSEWSRVIIDGLGGDGPYTISGTLTVPSRTIVVVQEDIKVADGADAILFRAENHGDDSTRDKHIYFDLRGALIDGNRANQTSTEELLELRTVDNFGIRGGYFKDASGSAISILGSTQGEVESPTTEASAVNGIILEQVNSTRVSDVTIRGHTSIDDVSGGTGGAVWLAGIEDVTYYAGHITRLASIAVMIRNQDQAIGAENVTVRDVAIDDPTAAGAVVQVSSHTVAGTGTSDVLLDNIRIDGRAVGTANLTQQGILISAAEETVERVTIRDCEVTTQWGAIRIQSDQSASSPKQPTSIRIVGGSFTATTDSKAGIQATDFSDLYVGGGVEVADCDGRGNYVEATNSDIDGVEVADVDVHDNGDTGIYLNDATNAINDARIAGRYYNNNSLGMQLAADGIVVHDAKCYNSSGSTQTTSIFANSGLTGVIVRDSDLENGVNDIGRFHKINGWGKNRQTRRPRLPRIGRSETRWISRIRGTDRGPASIGC